MLMDPTTIGRYQIRQLVGVGGMGSVYLAFDPNLDRLAAIKVLRDDTEDVRLRFAREARSAGRLHHPNIVTIYDVGEHDGFPFIAMEYVSGATLAERLRQQPKLQVAQAIAIAADVCTGLAYAHDAGLVHRDIKPANIMVADSGQAKILDFGIARLGASGITQAGSLVGTIGYMAPEQVEGREIDSRSDIYSAGCVLYEMLAGRKPFEGEIGTVIHKLLFSVPTPLQTLIPKIDASVAAIVERALQKSPAARYQTISEMRDALLQVRTDGNWDLIEPFEPTASHPDLSDAARLRDKPLPTSADEAVMAAKIALEAGDRKDAEKLVAHALALDSEHMGARAAELALSRLAKPIEPGAPATQTMILPPSHPRLGANLPDPGYLPDETLIFRAAHLAPQLAAPKAPQSAFADVRLVVTDSRDPRIIGRTFELADEATVLGRDGRWLGVADSSWSRRHAAIEANDGGFVIRDLGSSNGTELNGRRLPPQSASPIAFGARIGIGSTVLTFSYSKETRLPDLAGCLVDGRYKLERRLRDGTKSALFEASDCRLPGRVAIKLLSPELGRYAEYRLRMQQEAALARRLHHPHICQVLDSGEGPITQDGEERLRASYLCVELMGGGNLADLLERPEPFETRIVAEWITRIASAIDHAHRRDVVHGDLKPAAIVFDDDLNPYVTDFAAGSGAPTDAPALSGTPAYMAPELWAGGAPNRATDQFALAAVSYYMLTGSRPYEGQDNAEIRRRNFALGPLPAHSEAEHRGRPTLLRGVSNVLHQGMATKCEDRYDSVETFARALVSALVRPERPLDAAQVFFSYQRESSSGWVNYFADRLRTGGVTVFVDTHNRDATGVFPDILARAIEDCAVFVCFVGERTLDSRWIQEELKLAHHHAKPMIPVFQDGHVRPPDDRVSPAMERLLSSQGIHLQDRRNLNPDRSVSDLQTLIQHQLDAGDRLRRE